MAEAGHGHLLLELEDYATDEGSEVDDIDMPAHVALTRRVIIEDSPEDATRAPGAHG